MHKPDLYNAASGGGSVHAERVYRLLFGAVAAAIILMVSYLVVRLATIGVSGYTPPEAVLATLLLAAELFLMFHAVGYFASAVKASRRDARAAPDIFAKPATVPVAVLVAAFNESEEVLEQTLAAIRAMDYPRVNVYLLDDSTKDQYRAAARRLAERYNAKLKFRVFRAGYKAGAINDVLPELTEPYVAILDADQRPIQSWLKELIPLLERDPMLAVVQAPQVYINTERLPVARTARYQQAIFFEHICEGKAWSNAIFCCGSNVVLRRTALLSIEVQVDDRRQFFDETTVTEDFATSVRLHAKGWRTDYVNQPYVLGMGPETLSAYFTQHMRWSMGSITVGLRLIKDFFRNPGMLTAGQWWEYLLSGTYYFVGISNLIFMASPVAFILAGIRPLRTNSDLYLMFFVPYILFTMNLFFLGMKMRRYPLRGIWLATALSFSTSWTYVKAAVVAVFGLKRAFAVTPKGVGGAVPLRCMRMELTLFVVNLVAFAAGLWHLVVVDVDTSYVVTTAWTAYHSLLLSTLFFYFNRPVQVEDGPLAFAPASLAA